MGDGPAGLTAQAFEEQQAALGARLHASSGSDTTSFLLSSLSRELPATIALWANYVRNPGFRAEDMERARTLSLSGISQSLAEPTAIAQRTFRSDARRVGKVWVRTCRSRVQTENEKKKTKKK